MRIRRHAAAGHQVLEQPQDFRLHGGVQRAGGFVGDQQLGVGGEHHGDHHALAHAAGQLVRIGAGDAGGVADLHLRQQVDRACCAGLAAARAAMRAPSFGDLLAGGHHRVQREFRVLQDQPGALAADGAQLRFAGAQDVDAVERQACRAVTLRVARQQAQDRARGERLARPGFADDAELLVRRASARRRARRRDMPCAVGKRDGEVGDLDQHQRDLCSWASVTVIGTVRQIRTLVDRIWRLVVVRKSARDGTADAGHNRTPLEGGCSLRSVIDVANTASIRGCDGADRPKSAPNRQ